MKKVKYILSCFILYGFVGILVSIMSFSSDENLAMFQAMGLSLVFNFFATSYIRNFLKYLCEIEDDSNVVEMILNCVYSAIGAIITYCLLSTKKLNSDLIVEVSIIYFIFSIFVIFIENKKNKNSYIFYILNVKEDSFIKKCKHIILPLIFSIIWCLPIVILTTVLIGKMTSRNITNAGYGLQLYAIIFFAPHFFALLIGFIYSKVNRNISIKARDMNKFGTSPTGRLNYEMFLYIFLIIYFLSVLYINNMLLFAHLVAKEQVLGISFLLVMIPYSFIKWFSFDGYLGNGTGTIHIPKEKRVRATTIEFGGGFSQTTYKDDDGNVTKVDHLKF